jgi:elongation factor 2
MVRLKNVDQATQVMRDPHRIRNISIIAHVDHGKSTLTDSLVSRAGIINSKEAGDKTFTDNRDDEKERGITIKSTAVSLPISFPRNDEEAKFYLVNLIDCPGHVDFSGEVTAALRLTDGAVVVVDCVEGVCVQTEVVLRQALAERIVPVLFMNKVDRMFSELDADLESIYQTFCRTIESVNAHISLFQDEESSSGSDFFVDPVGGSVAFGSGLYNWGFTLDTFAEFYSNNTGVPKEKWMSRLWGDKFYNTVTQKWSKSLNANSKDQVRGFCEFVLKPIRKVLLDLQAGNTESVIKKLKSNGTVFEAGFEKDVGSVKRDVIRAVMSRWIPASEALLNMIINRLPSPIQAQKYRAETLYAGPLDDVCAIDISSCNASGKVMAYVAKMVPNDDGTRFIGVCRIFSGTISRADKLRVISSSSSVESQVVVQRAHLFVGSETISLDDAPCGMIVGLSGLEKCLVRSGTITSDPEAHPFKMMNFSVAPVVRMAVSAVNAKDSKKVVEGLRKLERTDPLLQVFVDEKTDECIIAGAGELHLEICISDLSRFLDGLGIKLSNPIVPFVETITASSDFVCLTKSQNKLNHLMAKVVKLDEAMTSQLEKCESKNDLVSSSTDLKKVWATSSGNMLMDGTKGVQGLSTIKPSVVKAFEELHGGVLCDEPIRGMRVDLVDCKIHSDNAHRGFNQIAPASKALFQACQLSGGPQLMEPMYEVSIRVPRAQLSGVYVCLARRKAEVLKTDEVGTNGLMFDVNAHLPVRESFGFTEMLRAETSGQAFPQLNFSHWKVVDGNPLEEGTLANTLVQEVRKRKGLSDKLPTLEDFHTKL